MTRLTTGQRPPKGTVVYLMRSNYGSAAPTEVEWFEADDNPEFVAPVCALGFYYAYATKQELEDDFGA